MKQEIRIMAVGHWLDAFVVIHEACGATLLKAQRVHLDALDGLVARHECPTLPPGQEADK